MPSDAPSCATSSAICSAFRVAVPSSSIAAVKLASPGLSSGFASLPVRSTRLAATIGRPRRSFRISVRPFGSVADAGVASCSGRAAAGFGISLRHGSSALIDSLPSPAAALRRGRRGDLRLRGRLPGHGVHHDARRRRQLIARERLQRGRRHRAIALDVLLQIIGIPEIVVVAVEPIGDAAEAAEPLETADDVGLDRVARALDLTRLGRLRPERRQLLVDRLLELLDRVSRPRRGLNLEDRTEHQRVLLRRDVLRDLLLVDQLLVQTARAAAAEDRRGDVCVGVARLEDRRGQPRHVHARQLDASGHDLAALGR